MAVTVSLTACYSVVSSVGDLVGAALGDIVPDDSVCLDDGVLIAWLGGFVAVTGFAATCISAGTTVGGMTAA